MMGGLFDKIEGLMKKYVCKECSTPLTAVCSVNAKSVTWRCENKHCNLFMFSIAPEWKLTEYDVKFLQMNMIDPFH